MTAPTSLGRQGAAGAVGWSLLAVVGRQGLQLLAAVVLARILGPESYGVVAAATVYVTLATLVLDQGLASALIQRKDLHDAAPGAVVTFNVLAGVVLGLATVVVAPWLENWFQAPGLAPILRWLGAGLLLKALAITPRALLSRALRFKNVAVADLGGALAGAVAGIGAALAGAGPMAAVAQALATDAVVLVLLWVVGGWSRPNVNTVALRQVLPFGLRVFGTNLIAYFARNVDNILVARFFGTAALSYYSMAYRVLVIPVQMIGQTVNRVMFPVLSRMADDVQRLGRTVLTVTRVVTVGVVPAMVLVACLSGPMIEILLGSGWSTTATLLTVLALAGARETVYYLTPVLVKATGQGSMLLRFEIFSTAVQVTGIVVGLQFGLLGVAVGYAVGGVLVTPVMWWLQRRLAGLAIRAQLLAMVPGLHLGFWVAVGALTVGSLPAGPLARLLAGAGTGIALAAVALVCCHRSVLKDLAILLPNRSGSRS